ncbi:MAG: hypothetical protein RL009_247, partial [Actinomycetota bacterium]
MTTQGAFSRILVVPLDHLNRSAGVLRDADPSTDLIVMVESQRMLTGRPWHKERLFFMVSSARHFAEDLRAEGFTVDYRQAATTPDGLEQIWRHHGRLPTLSAQPSSFEQQRQFLGLGIELVENDLFLT